jgi:phosphate-selective porin
MRWSNLDLTQKQVEGGELGIFSVGVNWWPVRAASFSANYRYTTLDRFGTTGKSSGLAFRLLLMLE